jgi:RNA polymerase sigma-70 factor, ECF subfamily
VGRRPLVPRRLVLSAHLSSFDPRTFTVLLQQLQSGNADAAALLLPLVYSELHGLAQALFAKEHRAHTLQPTALIHEVWLKLGGGLGGAGDRRHFFGIAALAMRQVLTDHARAQNRDKRGGGRSCITLDEHLVASGKGREVLDLIELEDTLVRLGTLNERHARMVEMRFFGGLTIDETAAALGVTRTTVERDWFTVRAWLRRELGGK